ARAVPDDEILVAGLHEVDVAVRRPEQRGGPRHDRLEQDLRVVAVQQGERRLAEGPQVRIGLWLVVGAQASDRLGQVEGPVGHGDEGVLWPAVARGTGDADADLDA